MTFLKKFHYLLALSIISSTSLLSAQETAKATPPAKETETAPAGDAKVKKEITGTVYFANGDSLSGKITEWNLKSISFQSPDLLEPVTFSTASILSVILDDNSTQVALDELEDLTTLILQHRYNQKGLHGVVRGNFSNIDDEYVTLNTSYAGKVKALKKFVTKMEIDSKKGYLYKGPNSLEEWKNNSITQKWQFQNNALISKLSGGNIAKDIQIPESAVISFDLSWKKDERVELLLYSSDPEQSRPDNYYKIYIQPNNRTTVHKYIDGRQVRDMLSDKIQLRGNAGRFRERDFAPVKNELNANYQIYMSKTEGVFHIFKNGKLVDAFRDSNPKPESFGTAIHLISNNTSPVRIKDLTLSKWSGHIPSEVDQKAFAELKGEGQRILLKNGDILLGQVGAVKDGMIKIETLYTPLNLPIVRMRSIDLTSSEVKEQPIMYENDVKCWFHDDGWIILKPLSINGNTLTAYHQALGENQFDLNAFKRIDLNIYEENPTHVDTTDDW